MNKKLQAEIWETQVILYWILSVLLFDRNHRVLGYICLIWGVISMLGTFWKLLQTRAEEIKAENPAAADLLAQK